MEKNELRRIVLYLTIITIVGVCVITLFKGCGNKPNPAIQRLENINDSLYQVIQLNNSKTDSLYQLEKLKVGYYSKITGIQADSYETLQAIYANKQAIEKAVDAEKDDEIKQLKARNRRLIFSNTALTIGITAIAFSTIYFTLL